MSFLQDVEGWPGFRVEEVDVRARNAIPLYKPNVVLINAGTNDATQGYNVATTKDRMETMIDFIFETVPDVCVVLSTLIPNTLNPGNVALINDQYRTLARELQGQGKRLILVDFGDGWMTTADLADTTVSKQQITVDFPFSPQLTLSFVVAPQ
jgi:lysophospholipase L1-like esterase